MPTQDLRRTDNWQVDLRSADLTGLDLSGRARDLFYADFDTRTVWPERLPKAFDPDRILEQGKNPGLGLRLLHNRGVTGKGVGIGVIDHGALLVEHREYRDRLRFYLEMPHDRGEAGFHCSAVASLAAGKEVGVAPEADLYFIGADFTGPHSDPEFPGDIDFTAVVQAIDRLLEFDAIRVIAIPIGWPGPVTEYNQMVHQAVSRARSAGVFLISVALDNDYADEGLSFDYGIGMGRGPLADPDLSSSYGPCYFMEEDFIRDGAVLDHLMLPMDSRSLAAATGPEHYLFCRHGGSSWTVPYAAGLYALACQHNPGITPVHFWKTAMATGDRIEVERRGVRHPYGTIVNPAKLLERLGT